MSKQELLDMLAEWKQDAEYKKKKAKTNAEKRRHHNTIGIFDAITYHIQFKDDGTGDN